MVMILLLYHMFRSGIICLRVVHWYGGVPWLMLTRLDRCLAVRDICKGRKEQGADLILEELRFLLQMLRSFEDVACSRSFSSIPSCKL
jgi:hypothetical protein